MEKHVQILAQSQSLVGIFGSVSTFQLNLPQWVILRIKHGERNNIKQPCTMLVHIDKNDIPSVILFGLLDNILVRWLLFLTISFC